MKTSDFEKSVEKNCDSTKMGYDNMISEIGKFGRYQRRIFLVLCLPAIACAFNKMGGVFLSAKADFRCLMPNESMKNATYELPQNITNMTYPWDDKIKNWPQCERYDPHFSDPNNATGENLPDELTIVKCDSFVYDKTQYTLTVSTEWDLVCDKAWLKTVSDSLFMLADMPGVAILGALSDKYGRKSTLLWGSITQAVCGLIIAVSPNPYVYMIFRILIGTTLSGMLTIGYVSVVEMASPKNRMTVGISFNLSFATGYILSSGLAYFIRKWRTLQIAFTVPTLTLLAFWWSIPESARWLVTKGRVEEAKDILQMASSENGIKLSRDTLDGFLNNDSGSGENIERTSVFDLMRYPNLRKKSLLLFFIWFVNSITYYGLSLNTSNLGGNDYLNFVIAAAVEIPAYMFLLFTLDRLGRRIILCGGMLLAGISLLLTFFVPNDMTWLMKVLAMLGKWAITCSWATAYIFTAEQYPTGIRNLGFGTCTAISKLGAAVAPYINYLFEISTWLPLVILGTSAFIAGLLSLLLPETLNEKLPESIEDAEQFGTCLRSTRKTERSVELKDIDAMEPLNEKEKETWSETK